MIGISAFTAGKQQKNSTMMNSRKIKIHTRYQKSNRQMITVPEIRLQGKWLDALGFGKEKPYTSSKRKTSLPLRLPNNPWKLHWVSHKLRKTSVLLRWFPASCGRLPYISVGFLQLARDFHTSPEVSRRLLETSVDLLKCKTRVFVTSCNCIWFPASCGRLPATAFGHKHTCW